MRLDRGPELFARFAMPPNERGYCGPINVAELHDAAAEGDSSEIRHLATSFAGAMPYLQLIAAGGGFTDPLAQPVVEAYWTGSPLLDEIDRTLFATSIVDRFVPRAGSDRESLLTMIERGRASHAFHVFCVYPWVGMLRAGFADQPLRVLDSCRIGWGEVVARSPGSCVVASRALRYDEPELELGEPELRTLAMPSGIAANVVPGAIVAFHWDTVVARLDGATATNLELDTHRHLSIVNQRSRELAGVVERAT